MTTPGIPATLAALAVPIDGLVPYGRNPRRGDLAMIAESLQQHGQYRPVVVRTGTNEVLAGNHTVRAAQALGWATIAATFVDVDDDTAARIVLVDNRANDVAGYDDEVLAELLAQVPDLAGTGYDQAFLDELLAGMAEPEAPAARNDPDEVPEPPADPVTRPGDVWLLGPHRVICGDCRDPVVVAALLEDRKVNVAFTSPPYASQRTYDPASGFVPIRPEAYVEWFAVVAANVRAVLADDGSWFVNIKEHCDDGQRHLYVKDLTIAHVRAWGWLFVDELCWVDTKNGMPGTWPNRFKDAWEPVFQFARSGSIKFRPMANATATEDLIVYDVKTRISANDGKGGGYHEAAERREYTTGLARPSNVLRIPAGGDGSHSAAFPVALPAWFLRAYSDPGDLAFDPFLGSGTTLIAAHGQGRVCAGVEISPAYCDVIARRWQEHTGVTPVLAATGRSHDFTEAAA